MHNCVMGKESSVIREMLKRIWVTLDSPVEGVAEFAAEALKTLLEMWHAEVKSERSDYVQLAEELMKKVIQVPWYARSRYKPFSLLIPYVHVDKVGPFKVSSFVEMCRLLLMLLLVNIVKLCVCNFSDNCFSDLIFEEQVSLIDSFYVEIFIHIFITAVYFMQVIDTSIECNVMLKNIYCT